MNINADYIRGFGDADGGMSGHVVQLINTDIKLLKEILSYLETIGVSGHIIYKRPKGHKICGVIQITGLRNLLIYADRIGFCMDRKQKRLMKRIKYLCRKGRPYNLEDYNLYLEMKDAGASYRKMASELGLSPSAVDRREKRGLWPLDRDLVDTIKNVVYKK